VRVEPPPPPGGCQRDLRSWKEMMIPEVGRLERTVRMMSFKWDPTGLARQCRKQPEGGNSGSCGWDLTKWQDQACNPPRLVVGTIFEPTPIVIHRCSLGLSNLALFRFGNPRTILLVFPVNSFDLDVPLSYCPPDLGNRIPFHTQIARHKNQSCSSETGRIMQCSIISNFLPSHTGRAFRTLHVSFTRKMNPSHWLSISCMSRSCTYILYNKTLPSIWNKISFFASSTTSNIPFIFDIIVEFEGVFPPSINSTMKMF
jgi:hypothetical protein